MDAWVLLCAVAALDGCIIDRIETAGEHRCEDAGCIASSDCDDAEPSSRFMMAAGAWAAGVAAAGEDAVAAPLLVIASRRRSWSSGVSCPCVGTWFDANGASGGLASPH